MTMLLEQVRSRCRDAVTTAFGQCPAELTLDIGSRFGDLALNAFYLARELKMAPPKIAAAIAEKLQGDELIVAAEAVTGYVNLTIDRTSLFRETLAPALAHAETFGATPRGPTSKKLMVEYSSPNTNKPQHLGHIRTNCLGESVARLLQAIGHEVVRANLVNDRGIHICKSMLIYQREGGGATPESTGTKGDHFVGKYYVLFEKRFQEEFQTYRDAHPDEADISRDEFMKMSRWMSDAQTMLQSWESGDPETVALWTQMNQWVLAGFRDTYRTLDIHFDRIYFESETYKLGKEIIERGLERGVFYRRADGAVEIDLSEDKLDKKVLLRSDGTSVYITQDLGTALMKTEEHQLDGQIYVVGNEQNYHFKVLFRVLEKLGYDWAKNLHHLSYGMINLPEGKMKSREGTVVDADELIDELTALAKAEIESRQGDAVDDDIDLRARKIALAALKFMILAVSPQTTMLYDPKASVSFEGDTGPYVLYAYARIQRMLNDSGIPATDRDFDAGQLGDPSEVKLVLALLAFPGVVARAAADLNPSLVSTWLIETARAYHSHNRAVMILKAETEALRRARLALSRATAIGLKRGLYLLGIETVDRM